MEQLTINGIEFTVSIESDSDQGTPWENEDGHGPVSEWTSRYKEPGELTLCKDRGKARFYDFAAACKQARKEGWGFLPGKMIVDRFAHHGKRKFRAFVRFGHADQVGYGPDRNAAVSNLYAKHRATMTARQYAAGAAMADYDRLRAWCAGDWQYVGVIVTCSATGESESLWGIESDSDDYLEEVAKELAEQIISTRKAVA